MAGEKAGGSSVRPSGSNATSRDAPVEGNASAGSSAASESGQKGSSSKTPSSVIQQQQQTCSSSPVSGNSGSAHSLHSCNSEDVDISQEKKTLLKSMADARNVAHSRSLEASAMQQDSNGTKKKVTKHSSCSSIIKKIRSRDVTSTLTKSDTSSTDLKGLTCAVCLEVYTNPKFLPCHHTYCAHCIEDLSARRHNKPFKCPSCRKEVTLPPGGVNDLQHNFYIKQEDLEKAARGIKDTSKCRSHPQQDLDMYCIQCEQVVCFKCVLTKHKEHALQDLTEAAQEAAEQLKDARSRLDDIIGVVTQHVERQQREQRDLEEKIAAIKRNLQNRHDTVVAAAKQYLQERLAQVDKLTDQVHGEVKEDASFAQAYLNSLCHLQKIMENAIMTKGRVELVESDRDMRVGFGCQQAVSELLSQRRSKLVRPVLHFQCYAADALLSLSQFLGDIVLLDMPAEDSEQVFVKKFLCGDLIDTEVFSICPKDNDTLSMSYERRHLDQQAPSEGVDIRGKHQYTRKEALGKSTWKSRGKGKGVFVGQLPGQMRTYSKGQNTEIFFRLDSHLNGYADVKRETIMLESPYKSKLSKECTIKCGPHRAFDVDNSQTFYIVVEESSDPFPKAMRRVLLFKKNIEQELSEWTSPLALSQPTDVCFYNLEGKEVVLVTDEMNDVIYVIDYVQGKLSFLRYLAAGSPLLMQPTALNIDVANRLWVACRGGAVLMMEQPMAVRSPLEREAPATSV